MKFPEITPSAKLPAVVAIVAVHDGGPCTDGFGTAACPHCGAEGRYVISFICEDGKRYGAMRGCFKLFPQSNSPIARLVQEAFKRKTEASEAKPPRKLASWWQAMITAAEVLEQSGGGIDAVNTFKSKINTAESARQTWLQRNGYKRAGQRR